MKYHCNILQWPLWYQDADSPSSANLGIQDICHENHTIRCWKSVKMFKDQNTEIGAWISLNLRITLFSPELSMSSPRMSTFPTWQFSRIRVLKKNSKSSVHPLHILKSTLHVMLHHKSVSGPYLRNYALGGRSNDVHSVDKHAKCLPTTNRIHQNTVHEKVSQDLWWLEPCEAIDIVLKALIILDFLTQPH